MAAERGDVPRLGYRPGLDGVRAFAVAGVLAVHTDVPLLEGGGRGVDVFFVLSGFLITTLLMEERWSTGGTSLRHFYARRALRLFPALVAVVAVVLGYALLVATGDQRDLLLRESATAITYTTNIFGWGGGVEQGPLNHTWTLALEEQFYLLWPLVFVALAPRLSPRRAGLLLLAVVGGFVALRLAGLDEHQNFLSQRPDALLLGCAGAFLRVDAHGSRRGRELLRRWVPLAGVVSTVALAGLFTVAHPLSERWGDIGFTLSAVAALAVVLLVVEVAEHPLTRAAGVAPLRAIGRISYGIYLWHLPIFYWVQGRALGWPDPLIVALKVALTLVVAAVSFQVIERPALRVKERLRRTTSGEPVEAAPPVAGGAPAVDAAPEVGPQPAGGAPA